MLGYSHTGQHWLGSTANAMDAPSYSPIRRMRSYNHAAYSRRAVLVMLCLASLLFVGGSSVDASDARSATIASRAFVITDPEILTSFTFDRVIGCVTDSPSALWLQTLLSSPSEHAQRRHVTMPFTGFIASTENGYWWPTAADDWSHIRPIAIVNRFDSPRKTTETVASTA